MVQERKRDLQTIDLLKTEWGCLRSMHSWGKNGSICMICWINLKDCHYEVHSHKVSHQFFLHPILCSYFSSYILLVLYNKTLIGCSSSLRPLYLCWRHSKGKSWGNNYKKEEHWLVQRSVSSWSHLLSTMPRCLPRASITVGQCLGWSRWCSCWGVRSGGGSGKSLVLQKIFSE